MRTFKFNLAVTAAVFFFLMTDAGLRGNAHPLLPEPEDRLGPTGSQEWDRNSNKKTSYEPLTRHLILWEEPADIETRDLFYGAGGRAGAPDPSSRFAFVRRSKSGTSEKIIVEDDRGRKWTIKFGEEAKPETTATRIVWAAGYHVDQDYFVSRTHISGRGGFDVWNVRFERRDDGLEEVGRWSWESNPFVGTRELHGLKVLMALLNNWDLKTDNNKVVRSKSGNSIHYVADLGATFGATGSFLNRAPFLRDLPPDRTFGRRKGKGNPEAFAHEPFIKRVQNGHVIFHHIRGRGRRVLEAVSVRHARWIGDLLGRLSDAQLSDAFRAGGFDHSETRLYVAALRKRIQELQKLTD